MNLITVLISFGWFFVGVTPQDPMRELPVLYYWQFLKYEYDSIEQSTDAENTGAYDFKKNLPVDLEVVPDGRIFVTILRDKGVPASLTTISGKKVGRNGPLLRPYPDWSWTNASDCDNLVAVYRTAVDECNRLWVLDTGKVGDDILCDPKLLAFDLATDLLVKRIDIPSKLARNADGEGLLFNLVVDTTGPDCSETNVYMADMYGSGLVIWNGQDAWRIESPNFEPDSNATEFSVHGTDFNYVRGLFALSLTPKEDIASDRLLYFRPMSSYNMFHTELADLHLKKDNQSSIQYVEEPTRLPSQSVVQAFSSRGILFFSGTTEMSILCWNRHKPFIPENIVTVFQNEETLQWADGIKIYPGNPSETIWILTNRWQDFYTNTTDFNDVNFRILAGSVDDLVRGTNCE